MGRYFPYTVHPITVGEILSTTKPDEPISPPKFIDDVSWENLWNFGGFPDPFIQAKTTFANQWHNLRHQQLFKEDIVDLSKVSDISQLEVLASLLESQVGQLVNYSSYGKSVRSSDQTIRRWIELLESVFYCFRIRPWFKNVSRSLRKEPKIYLWDWSRLKDPGTKTENFIACHLVKSARLWTQIGLGQFEVFFLRDKEKNEVDFLMVKDETPWFLVEVKKSSTKLSPSLAFFQQQLDASNAFQVVLDEPYTDEDCFSRQTPIIVPARTFLSQI